MTRTGRAKAVRRARRHSQLGTVLGQCPECGRDVHSGQATTMVLVDGKARFAHPACV